MPTSDSAAELEIEGRPAEFPLLTSSEEAFFAFLALFAFLAGTVGLGAGSDAAPGAVKMVLHGNERGANTVVDTPPRDTLSLSPLDGFGEGTAGGNIRNGSEE